MVLAFLISLQCPPFHSSKSFVLPFFGFFSSETTLTMEVWEINPHVFLPHLVGEPTYISAVNTVNMRDVFEINCNNMEFAVHCMLGYYLFQPEDRQVKGSEIASTLISNIFHILQDYEYVYSIGFGLVHSSYFNSEWWRTMPEDYYF